MNITLWEFKGSQFLYYMLVDDSSNVCTSCAVSHKTGVLEWKIPIPFSKEDDIDIFYQLEYSKIENEHQKRELLLKYFL